MAIVWSILSVRADEISIQLIEMPTSDAEAEKGQLSETSYKVVITLIEF